MPTTAFDNAMILRPAAADDESQIIALLPYLADFTIPPRRQPEHLWAGDAEMARAILSGKPSCPLSMSLPMIAVRLPG